MPSPREILAANKIALTKTPSTVPVFLLTLSRYSAWHLNPCKRSVKQIANAD